MTTAVARWIGMLIVIVQSYFNWPPEEGIGIQPRITYAPSHLAGLILARAGSKGIPHKNMVDLNGHPLIYWSLQAMIKSKAFTSIWVSTDDDNMSKWLTKAFPKVNVHHRAGYTATDKASSIVAAQEFLSYHPEIDCLALIQATSPFVQPKYLIEAKELIKNFESVFSVTRSHQLRWKPSADPSITETVPLNFDPRNRPRRQDWTGEMVENGMFYFTRRDIIVSYGLFQGTKSSYVEISKIHSLEIDTPDDLEIARYLMGKYIKSEKSPGHNNKQEL